MSATRNHNGSWTVSDIIDGYLVSRTYYSYTKRQALRAFREEMGV
jgi:hypothetical protein